MRESHFEDLAEQVYRALKEMILTGELVPGQKLVQEALSERLGVSRTPLLAAFSKLEKELLVELVPRRGAYVKRLSPLELLHLYDVRLRLEPLGAAEAARNLDGPGRSELEKAFSAYRDCVASGDAARVRVADFEFHGTLMRLSRNSILDRILSSFAIVLASNQRGLMKPMEKSLAEHEALIGAILRRDERQAEAVMYAHLSEARDAAAALVEGAAGPAAGSI